VSERAIGSTPPMSVILSAAKDPLRRVERVLTQWILRCAQDDDGVGI